MQGANQTESSRSAEQDTNRAAARGTALLAAVVSGAVFGGLGAWLGRKLGSQAGEHGVRLLGRTFGTWTGGLSACVAAAYSTYRQLAPKPLPAEEPAQVSDATPVPLEEKIPEGQVASNPGSRVALGEAAHGGMIRQMEMGSPTLH